MAHDPAGDVDYEATGAGYSFKRRTDLRIAALVERALGDARTVLNVGEGFYARPERLLEAAVRRGQSAWGFVDAGEEERFERTLKADLACGAWDARYGALRSAPFFDGSLRLIVARP